MTRNEYIKTFRITRVTVYFIVVCWGMFFLYFKPFKYLCDYQSYSCQLCGMRAALKAIIHLDFVSAYNNNRGIIAVVIIAIIILVDSIYIIKKLNNES